MSAPNPSSPRPSRRRRWPWILLGAVVVLLVLVVFVGPMLLDLERHRGRIEAVLEQATGWDAQLGEIGFSVLRGLSVTVQPVELTEPETTSHLEVAGVAIGARIFPLLQGRLEIHSIDLVEPEGEFVRTSEEQGWVLPFPAAPTEESGAGAGGMAVTIDRIDLSHGRLRLVDRTVAPALVFGVEDLDLTVRPASWTLSGSAAPQPGGGRLELEGSPAEGLRVTLREVGVEWIDALVGEPLLRPGGLVSGTITARLPAAVDGDLTIADAALASGEDPLEALDVRFAASGAGEAWTLDRLELDAGGARVTGSGPVYPDLALRLALPPTPLGPGLRAVGAVFPLPVTLREPGEVSADVRLDAAAGEEMTIAAEGTLAAATAELGAPLPPVESPRVDFALEPDGSVGIDLREGRMAGGALSGTAAIPSLDPLGPLRWQGELREASLGQLVAAMAAQEIAADLSGTTAISTDLTLDLGRESLDVRALGGGLALESRDVRLPGWDLEAAMHRALLDQLGDVPPALRAVLAQRLGLEDAVAEREPETERLFGLLGARLVLDELPWRLEGLRLESDDVEAMGSGRFDPLEATVGLALTGRLSVEETRELVARESALDALVGEDGRLTLPLSVEGPITRPRVSVAVDQVPALQRARSKIEREAREEVESARDELEEKAREELGGLLDRLRKKDEPKRDDPQ